jgi:hypothetical protein
LARSVPSIRIHSAFPTRDFVFACLH